MEMIDKTTKALLPQLIIDTVDALGKLTNAPDEMTIPIVLSIANFATQGLNDANPLMWKRCPVSEYFMILVPSGGMKSGVTDYTLDGIKDFEKQQKLATKQDITAYLVDKKKYLKDVEAVVKDPTLPYPTLPERPRGHKVRIEKGTTNGIINTLRGVPFSCLLNTDAAEFFNSHSFQDSNKSMEMISMLSKLWSGEKIERNTGIEDDNVELTDRRFNMLMLLQQQMAGFLVDNRYKDQGFTNRILITQAELFKKPYVTSASLSSIKHTQAALDPFHDKILHLLQKVIKTQIKQHAAAAQYNQDVEPNQLILDLIEFDKKDGAEQVMIDFYNKMGAAMHDPCNIEYQNFISRLYEHAVRLAATFAIFDEHKTINIKYAEAGCKLAMWFLKQRQDLQIDGKEVVDPIVEHAEKIRKLWWKMEADYKASGDEKDKPTKSKITQRSHRGWRALSRDNKKRVWAEIEGREEDRIEEENENE